MNKIWNNDIFVDPTNFCEPKTKNAVGKTPVSILVFRPLRVDFFRYALIITTLTVGIAFDSRFRNLLDKVFAVK